MSEVLHDGIPADLEVHARLPGVRPLADGRWLRVDEAYAGQMALRRDLLERHRPQVLWQDPESNPAVSELFEAALEQLPGLGFRLEGARIHCPDGHVLQRESDLPLAVLGRAVQEDLCVMEKRGDEHVLTAAVLCFPANWTLAEKAGKPLIGIHRTVREYDGDLARRVQRLFDGVQVGKPIWRNNFLRYSDAVLHQPAREGGPGRVIPVPGEPAFLRAERQCIARLPRTGAVVFSIHSYVAREEPDPDTPPLA